MQGHLTSQKAIYNGILYIQGGVNSTNDTFEQKLSVKGDSAYFSGTKTKDIYIKSDSGSQGVVCVSNGSKVTGVTFSGTGIVYVDGSSSTGPIRNGTLSHESCPLK